MAQRTAGWALPGYDVEELVGFGSVGEVWRAREQATGQLVALKRLRGGGGAAERDRLRREAAVLCGVVGPHLVRLRTVLATADGLVLVLDYAAGGSLAGLLAVRRRLTPGEVVGIAGPLATALAGVHAGGVVHGDVSPANVLFDATGRPLLADLGVARLRADGPPVAVTVVYADPAVLRGGLPGPACDVYGLAAVCHCALTGAPPYPAADPETVLRLVAAGRRRSLHDALPFVPPALAAAVEAALVSDPAARPDAAAFAARLAAAFPAAPLRLSGASVRVTSPPTLRLDASGGDAAAPPSPGPARPSVLGLTALYDAELPEPAPGPRSATTPAEPATPPGQGRGEWADRRRLRHRLPAAGRRARHAPRTGEGRLWRWRLRWSPPGPGRSAVRRPPAARRPPGGRHVRRSIAGATARSPLVGGAAAVAAVALGAVAVVVGLAWARSGARPSPAGDPAAGPRPSAPRGAPSPAATVSAAGSAVPPVAPTAGSTLPPVAPTASSTLPPAVTVGPVAPHPVTTAGPAAPHPATTVGPAAAHPATTAGPAAPRPATTAAPAPPETGGRTAAPGRPELLAVLRRLDAARGTAFARGDVSMLSQVYLTGSPAWRVDRATLQQLVSAGEHAEGLAPRIMSVLVLASRADEVTLQVDDVLPPYRVVDRSGAAVTEPGRGRRSWLIQLARSPGGWRMVSVQSMQGAAPPTAGAVGAANPAGATGRAPPRTGPPRAAP